MIYGDSNEDRHFEQLLLEYLDEDDYYNDDDDDEELTAEDRYEIYCENKRESDYFSWFD